MDGSKWDVPRRIFWSQERRRDALARLAASLYPRNMEHKETEAYRRRVLAFWNEHGIEAAKDAFSVSRPTLFRWKKAEAEGKLAGGSTAPKRVRRRTVPFGLESEILRLREEHPKLGKEKLAPLLAGWCRSAGHPVLSESTVGRILRDMKRTGRLPMPCVLRMDGRSGSLLEKERARPVKLRRGGYLPRIPGDLLQVDGVTVFVDGVRRYVFTAVDLSSRWAFSRSYGSASSRNGADFLRRLLAVAPFGVARIQTDNGSEFSAEFASAAAAAGVVQFFNWARSPKYQGWVERFNRTLKEEFLNGNRALLRDDVSGFNVALGRWLQWYNGERVHHSLKRGCQRLTPLACLALCRG